MDKLFRQVSVKERLPNYGRYFTNHGECAYIPNENTWYFLLKDCTESVEWWLEEVELPTIDHMKYTNGNNGRYEEDRDIYDDGYEDGANDGYIEGFNTAIDTLKGEKSNADL